MRKLLFLLALLVFPLHAEMVRIPFTYINGYPAVVICYDTNDKNRTFQIQEIEEVAKKSFLTSIANPDPTTAYGKKALELLKEYGLVKVVCMDSIVYTYYACKDGRCFVSINLKQGI